MSFNSQVLSYAIYMDVDPEVANILASTGLVTDAQAVVVAADKSIMSYCKGILTTVLGIANSQSEIAIFGPQVVDVDNVGHFGATIVDKDVGLVPVADITAGTYNLDRVRGGATTNIVTGGAWSKSDGRVYVDITFASANWALDDAFVIIPQGDTSYDIGGTTYYPAIPDIAGYVGDSSTVDGKLDTLIDTNGSADSSGTKSFLANTDKQTVVELTTSTRKIVCGAWLDMANATVDGTIGVEYKVDGTNYKIATSELFEVATMDDAVYLDLNMGITEDFKITYQVAIAEAGAIDIPYQLIYEVKE